MTFHSFGQRPALSGQARADETSAPDAFAAPTLSEAFAAHPLDGAAAGFVLAMLRGGGPVLWVQDRLSRREAGAPYLPGIERPLLRVNLSRPVDVLAALEDGLACPALSAVVGELHAAAPSFTATRRLALRAERSGLPCWLILHGSRPQPSAARLRWRVSCAPSAPHPDDPLSPGVPRWRAELFRARTRPSATWLVSPAPDGPEFSLLSDSTDLPASAPGTEVRHGTA
ncbi:hypothetical protein KTN05_14795 [Paracoccus sp. Z118]|uniref:ImuA family protein n=1 Tax=Paracoccus sp. Z118 TaxID=2851017 RepID=UPI001C2BD29E|nr:hypothetical protein [Paracoccus sp. Z118]MBV0893091.1 hypothetical protein [Paracoccus sp. Z118]